MQFTFPRRGFLKGILAGTAMQMFSFPVIRKISAAEGGYFPAMSTARDFQFHWEGLNPGYWKFENNELRRALTSVGARARDTGFPFHYENQNNPNGQMPREYDPSLPMSILWNRVWKLTDRFALELVATIRNPTVQQRQEDDLGWAMYQPGYGLLGIAFGGQTQFESFYPCLDAAPVFLIKEDGNFGLMVYRDSDPLPVADHSTGRVAPLQKDDVVRLRLAVDNGHVYASLQVNGGKVQNVSWRTDAQRCDGYFGIAARGLLDVGVNDVRVFAAGNRPAKAPLNDCHTCYALGDTLQNNDGSWQVRFVALFRSAGEQAQIRIAESADPQGGWAAIPAAGKADIVSNDFRVNTAIIDARLPFNPALKTLYYTVWKDGVDVTADPRIGTASVGPGTGLVGDVPTTGNYTGRLPQLQAPYRVCGLSCHAIHTASEADLPGADGGKCGRQIIGAAVGNCGIAKPFYVHDQPCYGAFQHLEDYNFQIMLWEDDVWYMELLLYPPSTEDAYKILTTTIAGPTTRWQMMRHWNVMNPGDHDYGMDDVKGPEQILIRNRKDLGQDPEYMVRNFQIVSHLMTGQENPDGKGNPKRWRKWKMPNRDFSLLVIDARLWRTSQDPAIWDDEGWGHDKELYKRTDPTRVLLGEEQFAWLSEELKTDSAPLMCLTGMNALHTIWGGHSGKGWLNTIIERDRVSADYAGWVKAGVDRILELIGGRGGVVTVCGDVHSGCIVHNQQQRVYECSFGPVGRWGGRSLVDGFGPQMKDHDGRQIECIALYHHEYKNPRLEKQNTVNYWNMLEAEFNPTLADPEIGLAIRNICDKADALPRGGGAVRKLQASATGRNPTAILPKVITLANADVLFLRRDGSPIRGARSLASGEVPITGLAGVAPGEEIIVLATSGDKTESHLVQTAK